MSLLTPVRVTDRGSAGESERGRKWLSEGVGGGSEYWL